MLTNNNPYYFYIVRNQEKFEYFNEAIENQADNEVIFSKFFFLEKKEYAFTLYRYHLCFTPLYTYTLLDDALTS